MNNIIPFTIKVLFNLALVLAYFFFKRMWREWQLSFDEESALNDFSLLYQTQY